MRSGIVLLAGFFLILTVNARAAELPPAADVRKRVTEPAATAPAQPEGAQPFLRAEIEVLADRVADMAPADAAAAWLALFDKYAAAHNVVEMHRFGNINQNVTLAQLLEALPPPAAWDDLAKAIAARPAATDQNGKLRETTLRLLAGALTSDTQGRKRDAEAVAELLLTTDPNDDTARALLMAVAEENTADIDKTFEKTIDQWSSPPSRQRLAVPDLVTLAGEARAAELLRRAVVLPNVELNVEVGDATRKLARTIVVEQIDKVTSPQWELCQTLDNIAIFEALRDRFIPKPAATAPATQAGAGAIGWLRGQARQNEVLQFATDCEYQQATSYYLLALVIAGRTDDAMAQAKRMPASQVEMSYGAFHELEEGGHGAAVQAFLHQLLSENPDLPLWSQYVSLSTKEGKTQEMLELARKSAARENLQPKQRAAIQDALAKALLAADQIDEGVAVVRAMMAASSPQDENVRQSRLTAAIQLARIGHLLQRPDLVEEGVAAAKKMLSEPAQREGRVDYARQQYVKSVVKLLEDIGRAAEAVDVLVAALTDERQVSAGDGGEHGQARQYAVELLGIYHRAGRHGDVLELLETLPSWGAKDLAEFYKSTDAHETPVGQMAAAALADAGRKEDALKVLHAVLDAHGGFDPAYELLFKLEGDAAVNTLDQLFARDQFEERPLIWKGVILLSKNQLDPAQKVIEQAIAIDPSDGEQGKGTRMRVYSVLADILERKGDAEKAKVFRGAVKAIRTAEDADDWWDAGLLSRAVKQYEQALTYFQDAYCIQSRLALRMAEMGLMKQAEEHYRKAYELMPDSFGRMESHCFGCEGAFRGKTARNIARDVFTQLIRKSPDKPQLHYLLGYLHEQQGAYKEAVDPFQTAVKLDADYINAWKHLRDLAGHVYLAPEIQESAALNVLRLDPLGRHASIDVSRVRDLKRLYAVASKGSKLRVAPPKALLPLPASTEEMQEKQQLQFSGNVIVHRPFDTDAPATPGGAIAKTRLIAAIAAVLDQH